MGSVRGNETNLSLGKKERCSRDLSTRHKMLIREKYLNKLIEGKDLNLIKVITGIRRSGKSTLLLQYKDYLLSSTIKAFINFVRKYK